jgi:hypothetical protein
MTAARYSTRDSWGTWGQFKMHVTSTFPELLVECGQSLEIRLLSGGTVNSLMIVHSNETKREQLVEQQLFYIHSM